MAFKWAVRSPLRQPLKAGQLRSFSVSSTRDKQWGFIGLGQMGYNMARNLQSKLPSVDNLLIYDVNAETTKRFIEEEQPPSGGSIVKVAGGVREVAENSETVITVLPESLHVKKVFTDILKPTLSSEKLNGGRLFIDCSTIDPTSSREIANAVRSMKQGWFVDAPMSGGVVGAKSRTLTFMLGASPSLVPRIKPILLTMGKRVLHCGEQGAGLSGKLANNYLLAINNIATAEAMNLGIRLGLDSKVLANLVNVSTGKCWSSEVNNPVKGVIEGSPASRDYSGGFGIGLMKKDLTLAIMAAKETGARLELADRAWEVYESAEQDERFRGKDFSVVYKYLGGTL